MGTPDPPAPGTYRVADGARVEFSAAMAAWVPIAHEILLATAKRYHSVITYGELVEEVQERSGIRTRMLLANWIGKLLENVAIEAKRRSEPPLTSLCVHQDGSIGEGYARAPKSVPGPIGDDIEAAAAEHRLLCYRAYAVDLPEDGGVAALTAQVVARRARLTPREPSPPEACPSCRMTVQPPASAMNAAGIEFPQSELQPEAMRSRPVRAPVGGVHEEGSRPSPSLDVAARGGSACAVVRRNSEVSDRRGHPPLT